MGYLTGMPAPSSPLDTPTPEQLLALRYGAGNAPATCAGSAVIDLLLAHRTVRAFKPDALPSGALEAMVAAAQSAATSSNLQTWSVVSVPAGPVRARCAELAGGQQHIVDAPCFLLWIADLARLNRLGDQLGLPHAGNDTLEMFLVAAIDASLAAQNAVVAAESLGLSTVYIGGMRNKPDEVAELIGLPQGCAVVFGLCVGHAIENAARIKPRLPQEAVLHHGRYDLTVQDEAIDRYNAAMADFYVREGMDVKGSWARHSLKRISGPESLSGRHTLMQALRRLGFFRAEN
jgi:nitroreductase